MSELLNQEALKELSIDDLLEIGIDEIEDAAGFVLPKEGMYRFKIKACGKVMLGAEDDQKPAIQVELVVLETLELFNTADEPTPEGSEFSVSYFKGTGVQYFKTEFGEAAKAAGASTVGTMFELLPECEITAIVKHRVNKKDGVVRHYPALSEINLVS